MALDCASEGPVLVFIYTNAKIRAIITTPPITPPTMPPIVPLDRPDELLRGVVTAGVPFGVADGIDKDDV